MSENKDPNQILELTPDMLDHITGGVMTDTAETIMRALIMALKNDTKATHTPQETIEFITTRFMDNVLLTGVTDDDVREYITTNWDRL